MQKRQITTRLYEAAYEDSFKAAITVLQDQGYVIKNTDINSGLILAIVDRSSSTGSKLAQLLLVGFTYNRGSEIEVSCIVNSLNESNSEIRISIQEVKYVDASILSGSSKRDVKQIYNPEVYQSIFDQIAVEIKRREAFNPRSPAPQPKTEKVENIIQENVIELYDYDPRNATIFLKNGNIIKGKILSNNDNSIVLQTSIGEISVEKSMIDNIERPSSKVKIILKDGSIISGEIGSVDKNNIHISSKLGALKIEKEKIQSITYEDFVESPQYKEKTKGGEVEEKDYLDSSMSKQKKTFSTRSAKIFVTSKSVFPFSLVISESELCAEDGTFSSKWSEIAAIKLDKFYDISNDKFLNAIRIFFSTNNSLLISTKSGNNYQLEEYYEVILKNWELYRKK